MEITKLQELLKEKYLSCQKHPIGDLYIWNYTQKAQFERVWTEETLACRGLIMDGAGNVISRPFRKFFNIEEMEQIPAEPFEVFDKWDGSLGISYWIGDKPYVATRGSFTSEQAIKGTELLHTKYAYSEMNREYSYLWEIIYPGNRIVVDYKGLEGLVLLAIIETSTGKELPYEEVKRISKFPVAKRYDGVADISKIRELYGRDDMEGFVIRFSSGLRCKAKMEEYVRLHRLITGINARHIWENLKEGKGIEELIDHVPDEFYQWVKTTAADLQGQFKGIEEYARQVWEMALKYPTRKEQAQFITQSTKQPGIVFQMLDSKKYDDAIWRLIKPKHEAPFKNEI